MPLIRLGAGRGAGENFPTNPWEKPVYNQSPTVHNPPASTPSGRRRAEQRRIKKEWGLEKGSQQ